MKGTFDGNAEACFEKLNVALLFPWYPEQECPSLHVLVVAFVSKIDWDVQKKNPLLCQLILQEYRTTNEIRDILVSKPQTLKSPPSSTNHKDGLSSKL
jgi:hypothetical protein